MMPEMDGIDTCREIRDIAGLKDVMIAFLSAPSLLFTSCNSTTKIQDGEMAYRLKKYTLSAEMLQKDYAKAKNHIGISQQFNKNI